MVMLLFITSGCTISYKLNGAAIDYNVLSLIHI